MSSTSLYKSIIFNVAQEYDGALLRAFLKSGCNVSSRMLSRLKLNENGILLNGSHATVRYTVHSGDKVMLNLPDDNVHIVPNTKPVNVVYEDESLLVFNKPPSLPVHPVRDYVDNTLANAVVNYAQSKGERYTFRAINRLDKDTSGCVLCAKNALCAATLKSGVQKEYYAVCEGEMNGSGTVNKPIALKEGSIMQREVNIKTGKPAVTHYTVIDSRQNHSLVALKLDTGRTHQIRVHMAYLGHPLAGDDMYGGSMKFIDRQALHCKYLMFTNPITNKPVFADSSLPQDFCVLLDKLGFDKEKIKGVYYASDKSE